MPENIRTTFEGKAPLPDDAPLPARIVESAEREYVKTRDAIAQSKKSSEVPDITEAMITLHNWEHSLNPGPHRKNIEALIKSLPKLHKLRVQEVSYSEVKMLISLTQQAIEQGQRRVDLPTSKEMTEIRNRAIVLRNRWARTSEIFEELGPMISQLLPLWREKWKSLPQTPRNSLIKSGKRSLPSIEKKDDKSDPTRF